MIEKVFNKPITILMLILTIIIFGIISIYNIPVTLLPEIEEPIISVITRYHGISADQIEKIITKPIENSISIISGIKELRSISEEGKSTVVIYFTSGTKMKYASLRVGDAVKRVSINFPTACREPYIIRNDPESRPLFIINLSSDFLNINDLRDYAEKDLKKEILKIEGVAEVDFSGGSIKDIHVNIDRDTLSSYNISILEVPKTIQDNYYITSGGDIFESNQDETLFVDNRFKSIEEMKKIPITYDDESRKTIRLGDLAYIYEGPREMENISRYNGKESVNIYIKKNGDANTIDLCKKIVSFINNIEKNKINYEVIYNQSQYIKKAINNLVSSAIIGGIIAILVLFVFFKDIKSIILISISIPFSILLTLFFMFIFKIKINVLTLSGMAIGIGMLLDNSIVMIDALYKDYEKNKYDQSKKIISPIIASTLTTIGVFTPFIFFSYEFNKMYGSLALTITFSLISSLLCAVIVIPNGFSLFKKMGWKNIKEDTKISVTIVNKSMEIIRKLQKEKKRIYTFLFFIIIFSLACLFSMDKEYFEPVQSNEITAYIELDAGTSLTETGIIVKNVEDLFKNEKGVTSVSSRVQKWHADIDLKFDPSKFRGKNQFIETMKKKTDEIKDCFVHYEEKGEDTGKVLDIDIIGDDDNKIREIAMDSARKISPIKGIREVVLRFKEGGPLITWKINRDKALFSQINIFNAGEELRWGIYGPVAVKYIKNNKEMDLRVKYTDEYKKEINKIKEMVLFSKNKNEIKLKELGEFIEGRDISKIYRTNKRKSVRIGVNLGSISLGKAIKKIEDVMNTIEMPTGYYLDFGDTYEKYKENQKNGFMAILLSIFMVYVILAIQFNSFKIPLLIVISVPISFTIPIIILYLVKMSLNMSVYIGLIVLCGIVVNNAILIADEVTRLKKINIENLDKIVKSRIKPIYITTITTILALLPMIFRFDEGSELWRSLGITLLTGLLFGTVFNLTIFPLFFLIKKAKKLTARGLTRTE